MLVVQSFLENELMPTVHGDPYWSAKLDLCLQQSPHHPGLHLAILLEPYLEYILAGLKTVESRFSVKRVPPYQSIQRGDVVLLKRVSGPIVGIAEASDAWFYQLDPVSWESIRGEFTEALCAQDPDFWEIRKSASFATLIRLRNVRRVRPLHFTKRDRRGWVVLLACSDQETLTL